MKLLQLKKNSIFFILTYKNRLLMSYLDCENGKFTRFREENLSILRAFYDSLFDFFRNNLLKIPFFFCFDFSIGLDEGFDASS